MPSNQKPLQIAIDGPVAAGKGTVACEIARRLKILYVDTGAMYRVAALLAVRNNIDLADEEKISELLKKEKISFKIPPENSIHKSLVFINSEEVTLQIRTPEISNASAKVAALPGIRRILVDLQKTLADNDSVVMEGRDIGTRVLENAPLKIFLTAKPEIRAQRRQNQLEDQGIKKTYQEVLKDTLNRDYQDSTRETDPLKITKDYWVLDTSEMTIEEVVEKIIKRAIGLNL